MVLNKDESKIDRRERDLYSRNVPQEKEPKRGDFTKPNYDPSDGWQAGDSFSTAIKEEFDETENKSKFFKFFFIGSIGFFIITILTFFYISQGGFNSVSSKNLDISIKGPVSIGGGDELVLNIVVTNNNNVPLTTADLLIEYPDGTRDTLDLSKELFRQKENISGILSGQSVTKTVKAVLFGEKDESKKIKVSVEYQTQDSNANFIKEKDYQITIQSSPVIFSVEYPKEANSNQKTDLTVTVVSNSNKIIEDLLVRAEYPFGFTLDTANPQASFDNNIWIIGDLKPKEKRVIKISGKIEGQNDEEKTFRFIAGAMSPRDEKIIGTSFVSSSETIILRRPFFDTKLSLNNNENKESVVEIGETVSGVLYWKNNLSTPINDPSIEIIFSGGALDKNKISSDQDGFYQSVLNKIVWNKNTVGKFSIIDPGETGSVSFNFGVLPSTVQNLAVLRNPEINLNINIKGSNFSSTDQSQTIEYSFAHKIKVATYATFNSRMVYSVGPFENMGSIPPKAEKETTYTVFWTIGNSFNDITNASVSATLPPYVKWVDVKSPLSEKIFYNPVTNKIIWEPNDIKAGVGFSSSPREVAFQVSFLPSLSQVGSIPKIIENIVFTGQDKFTLKNISITNLDLTTRITTDPLFDFNDEMVVK
jgi:hypothetical protein